LPGTKLKAEAVPPEFMKKKGKVEIFNYVIEKLSKTINCDCALNCFEHDLISVETINGCKSLSELIELYKKSP
jgi:hypothetical protein